MVFFNYMDTKLIAVGLIALLIGAGGGYMYSTTKSGSGEHVMPDGSTMHGQMSDMMAGLEGKTGDEFDRAFISEMIIHHEGAVEMAEAALVHAEHDEIKQMAQNIITAQTQEIGQMRGWQESWYGQ